MEGGRFRIQRRREGRKTSSIGGRGEGDGVLYEVNEPYETDMRYLTESRVN